MQHESRMEMPEWVGRARHVSGPVLEVGFTVWPDFYHGPENGFSAEEWHTLREPLYQPRVELRGDGPVRHVLTGALQGSVGELTRHYSDVLHRTARHNRPLARSHFWLSPILFSPGGFEIHFAYHDTREDAERVFQALEAPGDGELYEDVDQGWQIAIFASGDRLFIRHANFDTQEELAVVRCDRAALVRQVAPLRARLNAVLTDMEAALGGDYWSRRPAA